MSNDIVRGVQNSLVKDGSLSDAAGNTLLGAGAGVIGLGIAAWLLPVVTLPVLAVGAVAGGIALKVKSKS